MAVALALTALVGFGPSYFLRPVFRPTTTLTPLMHVHGLLFGAWTLLLVVQTTLVAARRTDLHRRLGVTSRAGAADAGCWRAPGDVVGAARRGPGGHGPRDVSGHPAGCAGDVRRILRHRDHVAPQAGRSQAADPAGHDQHHHARHRAPVVRAPAAADCA